MQAAFSRLAARRLGGRLLTPPNLLTLSRGFAAALLCGAAFSRRGLTGAWLGLMFGCTVADWLDGPLARRFGPTRLGGLLDLEADSWLTLWAAAACYRRGRLGGRALLAPALRYPLTVGSETRRLPLWQRASGFAQMLVLCAALSPWLRAQELGRLISPLAAGAQLAALVLGGDHRLGVGEAAREDDLHLAHRLPLTHD